MDLDYSLDILGVHPDCAQEDVKQAFRVLALAYHPDRYEGKDANERIRELNDAYHVALSYAKSNPNAGRARPEPPDEEDEGEIIIDKKEPPPPPPRGGGVPPEDEEVLKYMEKFQTQR